MQYRIDAIRGKRLSVLGFGCMRFPSNTLGKIDLEASESLVLAALDAGINYFDTAYLYPGNEEALGKIIARTGIRDRMNIASKLPHSNCRNAQDFDKYFDATLQHLQTDRIEYYLVHNVTTLVQWQRLVDMGICAWVSEQKRLGRIESFGFSFHGSQAEFMKLLEAYAWDFVQIQYNYANEHYQAGVEGLHAAAERGLPVFIMEPLLGGRLANKLPKKAQAIFAEAYASDQAKQTSGQSNKAAHATNTTKNSSATFSELTDSLNTQTTHDVHYSSTASCEQVIISSQTSERAIALSSDLSNKQADMPDQEASNMAPGFSTPPVQPDSADDQAVLGAAPNLSTPPAHPASVEGQVAFETTSDYATPPTQRASELVESGWHSFDSVQASADAGLQWLWNQPEVTMVLSGMNTMEQLSGNVESACRAQVNSLGPDDMTRYERVLDIFHESFRVPCTGCNYCMPCPKGINIPGLFQAYNNSYANSWFNGVFAYFTCTGSLSRDPHYATDCVNCGKCMRHCPQEIKIPQELKKVRRRLQPPGSAAAMSIASRWRA